MDVQNNKHNKTTKPHIKTSINHKRKKKRRRTSNASKKIKLRKSSSVILISKTRLIHPLKKIYSSEDIFGSRVIKYKIVESYFEDVEDVKNIPRIPRNIPQNIPRIPRNIPQNIQRNIPRNIPQNIEPKQILDNSFVKLISKNITLQKFNKIIIPLFISISPTKIFLRTQKMLKGKAYFSHILIDRKDIINLCNLSDKYRDICLNKSDHKSIFMTGIDKSSHLINILTNKGYHKSNFSKMKNIKFETLIVQSSNIFPKKVQVVTEKNEVNLNNLNKNHSGWK